MKRRKQRQQPQQQIDLVDGEIYSESSNYYSTTESYGLKSFNSTPDLQQIDSMNYRKPINNNNNEDDYNEVKGFKPTLRPKTPPPPPPLGNKTNFKPPITQELNLSTTQQQQLNVVIQQQQTITKIQPPPAPPPPPLALLSKPPKTIKEQQVTTSVVKPSIDNKQTDCRGISAEALMNVKLKPIQTVQQSLVMPAKITNSCESSAENSTTATTKKNADFELDLKSALARRRSKVNLDINEDVDMFKNSSINQTINPVLIKESTNIVR